MCEREAPDSTPSISRSRRLVTLPTFQLHYSKYKLKSLKLYKEPLAYIIIKRADAKPKAIVRLVRRPRHQPKKLSFGSSLHAQR